MNDSQRAKLEEAALANCWSCSYNALDLLRRDREGGIHNEAVVLQRAFENFDECPRRPKPTGDALDDMRNRKEGGR